MGGLFLILPVVALDIWLACTTGRRQLARWREQKNWRHPAACAAVGLLLAVWFAFFVKYNMGVAFRLQGFPIPLVFFHLDDKTWTRSLPPAPLPVLGAIADFLTGLAAPLIFFKIAEFLKVVKAELK